MRSISRQIAVAAFLLVCALPCFAGTARRASKALILNEIPFGDNKGSMLWPGSTVTGLMCVESSEHQELRLDFKLTVPAALTPSVSDERIALVEAGDFWVLRTSFTLKVKGQRWFSTVRLTVPENTPAGEYSIHSEARVRVGNDVEVVESESRLRVVARKELAGWFRMGEAIVPSNENGEPDDRQQRDTILIKGNKTVWQNLVPEPKDSFRRGSEPAAFATLPITNTGTCDALLLVKLDFLNPDTRRHLPGFEIPYAAEHGDTLGEEGVYQVLEIPSGSTENMVLPIYTNVDVVEPGRAIATVGVFLFGTDAEVARRDLPVILVGSRMVPAATTVLALVTALVGLTVLVWRRKRLFAMKSRELILIALFGTVTFAVVNIPGTLLLHVAHVILGPLSFLLTGFFYEILLYLLLVSLVVLIPRMGVVTLVFAVRFLLSSFVLGEFTPVSFIHFGTAAVCLETAVWCVGFTRASPERGAGRTRIVAAAVVLGLTDVYLSFIFFNLSMFFYRLYYATWYLTAYLIVNGFLFTAIAVPFGFKLGQRLKVTTIG